MLGLKASPDAEADADDVIHWVNNKDKLSLLQLDREGKSEWLCERERWRLNVCRACCCFRQGTIRDSDAVGR